MKIFGQEANLVSLYDLFQMISGLLGRAHHHHKSAGESKGKEEHIGRQANIFGFGIKDETLFWEAVALAKAKNWMKSPDGEKNIHAIVSGLGYWERRRFYHIIGQESQSVSIEIDTAERPPANTPPPYNRRRKSHAHSASTTADMKNVEKTTLNSNVQGALLIAFFASMQPSDAIAFLQNSGTLNGITDDIGEIYKAFAPFIVQLFGQVKAKKILDQMNQQAKNAMLKYLGAKTIASAKRKVATREQEVARLRAQSFYTRNLKGSQTFTWVVSTLVVIIVTSVGIVIYHS